jgi:hypothetical protein
MKRLIAESKAKLRTKKGKSPANKKAENAEKESLDYYPCPRCKEIKWMKVPDGSGRSYCLKCGEVIQYSDKEKLEETTNGCKTSAKVSCDEVETKVGKIPLNEQTPEADKIFCEYRCNDCQEIVVACGNSLKKAKDKVAFHTCGGRLIYVRQINPKIAGSKERFSHPKIEKAVCEDCFYDSGCPRSFKRLIGCLLRDVVYNIKRFRSD